MSGFIRKVSKIVLRDSKLRYSIIVEPLLFSLHREMADSQVLVHRQRQEQQSRAIDRTADRSRCMNEYDSKNIVKLKLIYSPRDYPLANYAMPL